MNTPPRLVSAVRTIFGTFRVIFFICLLVSPLGFIGYKYSSPSVEGNVWLSDLQILQGSPDTTGATVKIKYARAVISNVRDDAQILSLRRRVETPLMIFACVGAFAICHLLWQLCRNVESGQVFTESNFKGLRKLGWVMILFAAVDSTMELWRDHALRAYLVSHSSIEPAPFSPLFLLLHLNLVTVVLGLLVLILARVFAYGLTLKQDSELTV
jgi:hypothetical protein